MRAGYTPDLEIECRRPDSAVRTYIDAEIEVASDVRRRRAQWILADGVVLRTHDFPASSALTAAGQTTALTLSNAPAGNDLYEVHYSVQITPIIPGAGSNTHVVEVAIDTRPAAGSWTERVRLRYESIRTVGQSGAIVRWPHEDQFVRVAGMTSTHELRLRVVSASGPGGWSFVVHGFNVATNGDPVQGVNYHTGLAVDFPQDGGVMLADSVETLIESATSDGYQTDLDGSYANAAASPFLVARIAWGGDDHRDIPIDRIVAYLNPRVDGGQPRNVHLWLMRPYAVTRLGDRATSSGSAWNQTQVDPTTLTNHLDIEVTPLSATMGMFASAGDSPEEVTFSYAHLADAQKPHPKRYNPGGLPASMLGGPVTLVLIWAIQRDGSPATNVGWGQDSTVQSVSSGSKTLRTVQMRILDLSGKWILESPERGASSRSCYRTRIETGNYPSSATVAFTGAGAGSRFDLGVTPTKTVQFICRADVPTGASAVFQVRNDADSGWVTVTDGQNTDDLGLSKTQTRKAQVIISATSGLDATPVVYEFGMRELEIYPLWHCASLRSARWAVDPLQLLTETTNATVEALRDDLAKEFRDRVTLLLRKYYIGQLTLRAWAGTPERPRWLHIDDFLIDDEEFRGPEASIPCLGVTCLERGQLPTYDTTTQQVTTLVYANKSLKFAYDDIMAKIGVSGRFLGDGIQDAATPVSKTIEDSDAKAELDALSFLDGSARISSQGRIKAVRIFGEKAVVRAFSRQELLWGSVTPGYRQRVPELRVPWNWNYEEDRYRDEVRSAHATAVLRLGRARVDAPLLLPDAITKWIATNTLAERIGARHVGAFGPGLMLWFFQTEYACPQLEPGDCVTLPTDLFAGRDPTSDREIAGEIQALGVIVEAQEDFRTFGVLIRSYADITGGMTPESAGLVTSPSGTSIESVSPWWLRGRLQASLQLDYRGRAGVASVKIASSTSSQPADGTGTIVNGQSGQSFLVGKFANVTVYVTVTPYSGTGATGVQGVAYRFSTAVGRVDVEFPSSSYSHSGMSAFNAAQVENQNYNDTAWHTDTAVPGAWVKLDCGSGNDQTFTECRLYALSTGYAGVYDIEYSDNDSTWTAASTGFQPRARGANIRTWVSAGAHRYWRVKLTNTPGSGPWISELNFVSNVITGPIIEKPVLMDSGNERAITTIDDAFDKFRAPVKESGGKAVNRLLAKTLAGDVDTYDGVPAGTHIQFTGLKRTATVASEVAHAVSKRTGVFFHEWMDETLATQAWASSDEGGTTQSLVSSAGVATVGTNVLQAASGMMWRVFPNWIAFNPSKLYRLRCRVRATADATGDYNRCYIGFKTALADLSDGNNNGGYAYVCVGGLALTVAGGWQERTGWVKGASLAYASTPGHSTDPSNPTALNVNVVWVKPMIALNYNNGGSVPATSQIDYFTIEELDEDAEQRTYGVIQSDKVSLFSTTKESGGKTVARLLAKALAGDADSMDGCPDGSTYKRVLNISSGLVQTGSIGDGQVTKAKTEGRNRCSVFHSSNVAIVDSTLTTLNWDSENFDVGTLHDTSTNNSRITIPTGGDTGLWLLVCQIRWIGVTTGGQGSRYVNIKKNGATIVAESWHAAVPVTGAGDATVQTVLALQSALSVNDYFEVQVYQTAGANRSVQGGSWLSFFAAHHIW